MELAMMAGPALAEAGTAAMAAAPAVAEGAAAVTAPAAAAAANPVAGPLAILPPMLPGMGTAPNPLAPPPPFLRTAIPPPAGPPTPTPPGAVSPISQPTPIERAANTTLGVLQATGSMRRDRLPAPQVHMSPVMTGGPKSLVSRPTTAMNSPINRYLAMLRR